MTSPKEAGPGASALRELVMPVVVVTAGDGEETACATGTTSYVSLQPPVLCVALTPESRTARMVVRTGKFGVSLLAAGQAGLAQRAGRPAAGPDKLAAVGISQERPPAEAGEAAPPGVEGAAAVLWCEVTGVLPVGDHQGSLGSCPAAAPQGSSDRSAPSAAWRTRQRCCCAITATT